MIQEREMRHSDIALGLTTGLGVFVRWVSHTLLF